MEWKPEKEPGRGLSPGAIVALVVLAVVIIGIGVCVAIVSNVHP